MSRRISIVLGAGLGLALSACSLLQRPLPEKQQFVLEASRTGAAVQSATGPFVLMRPFRPSPRLDGARFVYRIGPERFVSDFHHVFWQTPEDLIADQTGRWLGASGLFGVVTSGSTVAKPAFQLEGAVADLYADFSAGSPPQCVIALRFALVDVRRAPASVVFHADYAATKPAASNAPEDLVRAWNAGLAELLARLEGDLRGAGVR